MRPGRLAILIIFFSIIQLIYTAYCPSFPRTFRPPGYAFWRVIYYISIYLLISGLGFWVFKNAKFKPDKIAALGLFIYGLGKGIYYIFLINKDLPTYIQALNSKTMDIVTSLFLWFFAIFVWVTKFNVLKLLKYERRS